MQIFFMMEKLDQLPSIVANASSAVFISNGHLQRSMAFHQITLSHSWKVVLAHSR